WSAPRRDGAHGSYGAGSRWRDRGLDLPGDRDRRAGDRRRHARGARIRCPHGRPPRDRRHEGERVAGWLRTGPARADAAPGELRLRARLSGEFRRRDRALRRLPGERCCVRDRRPRQHRDPAAGRPGPCRGGCQRWRWTVNAAATMLGQPKAALDTPALLVDLDLLEANIARIAATCRRHGVGWRPHMKGHKTVEIARMELAAGAIGITCAKLGEAEVMAAAGIPNILIANQ